MTSHTKTFRIVCRLKTDSCSYAIHQLFEQSGHPLEWLKLSIQKKLSAAQQNCQLFERLELSVQKNCYLFKWLRLSVRKQKDSHSNGLSYQFEKIVDGSSTWSYLFNENFSRVSIPKQFPGQPLLSNDLLFSRYSWVVTLRTLFTNASWIVMVPLLLLYSHLCFHNYHSIINSIDTSFIQNLNFVQQVLWK